MEVAWLEMTDNCFSYAYTVRGGNKMSSKSTLDYLDYQLSGLEKSSDRIDFLIGLEKSTGKPVLCLEESINDFAKDNISKIMKGVFNGYFNQESVLMLFDECLTGHIVQDYVQNKLSPRKQLKLLEYDDIAYGLIFQILAELSKSDKVLIYLINHPWFDGAFEKGDTIELLLKRDDLSEKVLKALVKYDKQNGRIYEEKILAKLKS